MTTLHPELVSVFSKPIEDCIAVLSHLTDNESDDIDPKAARRRISVRMAYELDWLTFVYQRDTDEGKTWLLYRSVRPTLETILQDYRLNVVFGYVTEERAYESLCEYLHASRYSSYTPNEFVRGWECRGSHLVCTFYNHQECRLKMDEVARLLLTDFHTYPNPLALMYAASVRVTQRLQDAIKSDSMRVKISACAEAIVLQEAALALLSKYGDHGVQNQEQDRVAEE